MTTVILLALASTTCAACSTVLKHRSASAPVRPLLGGRVPAAVAGMIANPLFLLALVFDGAAVALQVLALRYGNLSTVQPILTLTLVISLGLDHAASRTALTRRELIWAGTLVSGLVLFLASSGASHPKGGRDIGNLVPGFVLAGLAVLTWGVALLATSAARPTVRARALAVVVAMIYASTAALMKACTRIAGAYGYGELARSWQLWTLLVLALVGLVLNQHVFALAPLNVSLPIITSLDPLLSVVIGRAVFDERLLSTPTALVFETIGLALLVLGVARLSKAQTVLDDVPTPASGAVGPTGRQS